MRMSESITKIAPAMAKAWSDLTNPKHNASVKVNTKNGGSYKFEYTDLGGIIDAIKPIYKENGISIIQNPYTDYVDGKLFISVETMLLHSSGEWMMSDPLKMPANNSIQDMGGQVTYMKRYSLSAMLGLSTEKDDDANGASGNDYQMNNNSRPNKASEKQLSFVNKLLEEKSKGTKYNPQQLYQVLKGRLKITEDMENWTAQEASRAIKHLNEDKGAPQNASA